MSNPVLISETSCTHEFCDESGYVVAPVTAEFLSHLEKWGSIVKTLPEETTEVCFAWWDFELVDYPDDWDSEFAEVVEELEGPESDEPGYRIVASPTDGLSKLEDLDTHRTNLREISFIPGKAFDGEFRFKCHFKNDATEFVSRMIKLQDIREILNAKGVSCEDRR